MKNLLEEIEKHLDNYKCKFHNYPSFDNPHGCTDCYNTGYTFDNPEAPLLADAYYKIKELEQRLVSFTEHHEKMCFDYTDRINAQTERLAEAEKVIEFIGRDYANGMKVMREYQSKYLNKEKK